MLEKNILDRIVKFFKSIGTKEASGEPIDLGRHRHDSDSEEKQIRIHHDVEIKSEAPAAASEPMIKVVHEDNEKSEPQKEQTHNAVVVAKVHPRREYSQALEILRNRYPWRKLKAEKVLSVQDLPEPFYFLTSDNQPVEASKFEVSFVKELLAKAAEAGIENKFSFSLSSTMSITVKYKKKLVGRVYLHGRKHKMSFKSEGKTVTEENLTLSECKKLIPIWIGQIKEF